MINRARLFANISNAMYEPMLVGEIFAEKREMTVEEFDNRIEDIKAFLDYYAKAAKKAEKEQQEYEELVKEVDEKCNADWCELKIDE